MARSADSRFSKGKNIKWQQECIDIRQTMYANRIDIIMERMG